MLAALISAVQPSLENARRAAGRVQSANDLRQIAMAMFTYANDHQERLPAAAIHDAKGKAL